MHIHPRPQSRSWSTRVQDIGVLRVALVSMWVEPTGAPPSLAPSVTACFPPEAHGVGCFLTLIFSLSRSFVLKVI